MTAFAARFAIVQHIYPQAVSVVFPTVDESVSVASKSDPCCGVRNDTGPVEPQPRRSRSSR